MKYGSEISVKKLRKYFQSPSIFSNLRLVMKVLLKGIKKGLGLPPYWRGYVLASNIINDEDGYRELPMMAREYDIRYIKVHIF